MALNTCSDKRSAHSQQSDGRAKLSEKIVSRLQTCNTRLTWDHLIRPGRSKLPFMLPVIIYSRKIQIIESMKKVQNNILIILHDRYICHQSFIPIIFEGISFRPRPSHKFFLQCPSTQSICGFCLKDKKIGGDVYFLTCRDRRELDRCQKAPHSC